MLHVTTAHTCKHTCCILCAALQVHQLAAQAARVLTQTAALQHHHELQSITADYHASAASQAAAQQPSSRPAAAAQQQASSSRPAAAGQTHLVSVQADDGHHAGLHGVSSGLHALAPQLDKLQAVLKAAGGRGQGAGLSTECAQAWAVRIMLGHASSSAQLAVRMLHRAPVSEAAAAALVYRPGASSHQPVRHPPHGTSEGQGSVLAKGQAGGHVHGVNGSLQQGGPVHVRCRVRSSLQRP